MLSTYINSLINETDTKIELKLCLWFYRPQLWLI